MTAIKRTYRKIVLYVQHVLRISHSHTIDNTNHHWISRTLRMPFDAREHHLTVNSLRVSTGKPQSVRNSSSQLIIQSVTHNKKKLSNGSRRGRREYAANWHWVRFSFVVHCARIHMCFRCTSCARLTSAVICIIYRYVRLLD